MDRLTPLLQTRLFGITVGEYGLAFLFILAGYLLRWVLTLLIRRGKRLAERSRHPYDDAILAALERPLGTAAVLAGLWAAFSALPLPTEPVNIARFIQGLLRAGFIIAGAWFLVLLTDRMAAVMTERAKKTETLLDDQLIPIGRNTLRIFFIIIGGAGVVQEMGYSVTSLLAGLGIGGMAVALASRDTLANLFGSVVIFIDRPFHVGDWVEIGDLEGTVEEVGLRVTRIRTFANSLITLPNATLTTTAIQNWSRMRKRRIKTTIGLTYDTTPEQMEAAVEGIREVLRADPRIHQDFFLVNFTGFGAYSLDILLYCFTVTTAWAEHLQVRQELLLAIYRKLEEMGLEIAFPTQTVHIAKEDGAGERALPGEPKAMGRELPG